MDKSETAALVQRLRERITLWRAMAMAGQRDIVPGDETGAISRWTAVDMCADELERLLTPRTQLRDGVVRPRPHGCHHRPSEGPMGATELGNDTTLTEPVTDFAHLQRIADMHRQMTLNMSESRDELKHENRTLKAKLATLTAERDAARAGRPELEGAELIGTITYNRGTETIEYERHKPELDIHDPHVVGFDQEDDVPLSLRRELLKAATAKAISYYWLCAIYRRGRTDAQVAADAQLAALTAEGVRAYQAGWMKGQLDDRLFTDGDDMRQKMHEDAEAYLKALIPPPATESPA